MENKLIKSILAALGVISVLVTAVFAANEANEPKHGGKVVETSGHHVVEFVASGDSIEVYVTHDNGNPEDTKDAKATATILAGGKKEEIALTPAAANSFRGLTASEIGPGTVVVVTLTLPGHKPEQARVKLD
jgi:hypothetical protein